MYKLTEDKRQQLINSGLTDKQVRKIISTANKYAIKTVKDSNVKDKKAYRALLNIGIDTALTFIALRMGNITKKLMTITSHETKTYLDTKILDLEKASHEDR